LVLYRHGLYVIGGRLTNVEDDVRSAPIRVFAIERFADAEHVRTRDFTTPSDLNLRRVLARGFGPHIGEPDVSHQVVIEFSPAKALFVSSREWHPSQQLERTPNGALRLTFTCADLAPVVSWILEWGPHAKVLEPSGLAEKVVRELRGALARYD
jgi:predicted DNA-binding transcriptional regulator YafY